MREDHVPGPLSRSKFRQFLGAARSFFMALGIVLLCACVPLVPLYPHVDVPDVVYLTQEDVGAASFPLLACYPYHGIYISIYLRTLYFGNHVPEGTVVQLDDQSIQLEAFTTTGPYSETFAVQAAPHSFVYDDRLRQFGALSDPYTSGNYLGPLAGAGQGRGSVWYLFRGIRPSQPSRLISVPPTFRWGAIVLPSLTINGVHYAAQRLPFVQKRVFGFAAVNS